MSLIGPKEAKKISDLALETMVDNIKQEDLDNTTYEHGVIAHLPDGRKIALTDESIYKTTRAVPTHQLNTVIEFSRLIDWDRDESWMDNPEPAWKGKVIAAKDIDNLNAPAVRWEKVDKTVKRQYIWFIDDYK